MTRFPTAKLRRELQRRRSRLARSLRGGVALFPSYGIRRRNIHHEYPFRPESCFYYLSGCSEPNVVALLAPADAEPYRWFVPNIDAVAAQWDGAGLSADAIVREFDVDRVHSIDELPTVLESLFGASDRLYHRTGINRELDRQLLQLVERLRPLARRGRAVPREFRDAHVLVEELRAKKSAYELKSMKRAAEITATGHLAAYAEIEPGRAECEIEARLGYEYRRRGATGHAYLPIVAGGSNAATLHYTRNEESLADGDLVLIDSGAEFDYYACDVTRTIPVSGTFDAAQRAAYSVVLQAQEALLARIAPGVYLEELQTLCARTLARGLIKLGVVKGTPAQVVRDGHLARYFPHSFGHWIGLDTHDPNPYRTRTGEPVILSPGMTLTIEPGIYFPTSDRCVPKTLRGCGIRIEDTVVVTRAGSRVLTANVPKTVREIEKFMKERASAEPESRTATRDAKLMMG